MSYNLPPLVLLILDGFGLSPQEKGNAIFSVPTPNFDQLLSYFPHSSLHASGQEVGLSWGEMGNSEVGHLNLGTGRLIMQDLPRIDKTIQDGTFFQNAELVFAYNSAKKNNSNLHLIGLTSLGGVHSHINHLFALLDLAKKLNFNNVFIHMITDGRDTPEKVALDDLKSLEVKISQTGIGKVASVSGRYFAMDRDKHWDRVQKAYDVMFNPAAISKNTADIAITEAYNAGQTDEFIEPAAITDTPRIKDGDSIVFFNYRSDRARELTDAIVYNGFKGFRRRVSLNNFYFCSFTSYGNEPSPNVKVAFFAEKVNNPLGKIIAENNLGQLHLAETEKYAHVTYFFNAGQEKPFIGEQRILVPSPKVATYDLKPEMSVNEVTNKFIDFFKAKKPQFSVINFANPDMVGHTGVLEATKSAIIAVDQALGNLSNSVLSTGGNLIVTADHGNAEQMINPQTGEIDKEHTTNPVPLILCFQEKRFSAPSVIDINYKIALSAAQPAGVLADVAATALDILGLPKPKELIGQSLRGVI